MLSALDTFLPELRRTEPNGGFYVWLTLPDGLDSKGMLPRAVTELVAYTPGTAFYSDGGGRDKIRLAFCYPSPEAIHEGIRRLEGVIRQEVELIETFRPPMGGSLPDHHFQAPPPDLA